MATITLQNEYQQLALDPAAGMNILAWRCLKDGNWLALTPDIENPGLSQLTAASFIMAPYSNRIRGGHFSFAGKDYQLQRADENAIHGDVRTRSWTIVEQDASSIKAKIDTRDFPDFNWPWSFVLTADYSLHGFTWFSQLTLTSTAEQEFPAGMGWHPYFRRYLTHSGEEVRLQIPFTGIYPLAEDNCPIGKAVAPIPELDFSTEKQLSPNYRFDFCACGFAGKGHIVYPESEIVIDLTSQHCSHLVAYNPVESPEFAIEPVTNANDGVNLLANDSTGGMQIVKPGQSIVASCEFTVQIQK